MSTPWHHRDNAATHIGIIAPRGNEVLLQRGRCDLGIPSRWTNIRTEP
jgi:hypothetical protein